MVTATASNAKRRDFAEDAEALISDIRQSLSDSGLDVKEPAKDGAYTFSQEEIDAVNMAESEEEVSVFSLLRSFGGDGEAVNSIVSPAYSIAVLSGETNSTGPLDMADTLYGNKDLGDELEYPVTVVTPYAMYNGRRITSGDNIDLQAGSYFSLFFEIVPQQSYEWTYNGDNNQPLYDRIDEAEIHFKLPTGLKPTSSRLEITEVSEDGGFTEYSITQNNLYPGGNSTVQLDVYLEGNGELPHGENFALGDNWAWVISTITATDYSTSETKEYEVPEYADGYDMTVTSTVPDEWGISKTVVKDGSGTAAKDWKKVTENGTDYAQIQYTISVGLLKNGSITSLDDDYLRTGRTGFEDFQITDTVTVPGISNLNPSSVSVTMGGEELDVDLSGNSFTISEYRTLGGESGSGNVEVADTAPGYTQYTVTVKYPYEEFLLAYYEYDALDDENDKETYLVENTAELKYQLSGKEPETAAAEADALVRDRIDPVTLRIEKKIKNAATGNFDTYGTANADRHTGYAGFEIQVQNEETGEYEPYEHWQFVNTSYKGDTIMVNPKVDEGESNDVVTGDSGYVEVYLEPGKNYQITEETAPEYTMKTQPQTLTSEEIENALESGNQRITKTFQNELSGQGGIQFRKGSRTIENDGTVKETAGLSGIRFGLFAEDETEFTSSTAIMTATSGSDGYVTFYPVDASLDTGTTYIVREYGNAYSNGYLEDRTSYRVTVKNGEIATLPLGGNVEEDPDNPEIACLYNDTNRAKVTLTKKLVNDQGEAANVPASRIGDFAGSFSIQKKGADDAWTDVEGTTASLGNNSTITWTLNRYDENGELIQYRIREKLPDGYDVTTGSIDNGAPQSITPSEEADGSRYAYLPFNFKEDSAGNPKNVTAEIENTRTGNLTVTKNLWSYTASGGINKTKGDGWTIGLFTKSEGQYKLVRTAVTGTDGQVKFTDLPVLDSSNAKISYYIGEAVKDDSYRLDGTFDSSVIAVSTYHILTTAVEVSSINDIETAITNVQQKIPYWIKKVDAGTDQFPVVSGANKYAEVTVTETGTGTEVVDNKPITTQNGLLLFVDAGKTYTVTEDTAPDGYYRNAAGATFTAPSDLIITTENMDDLISGHSYTTDAGKTVSLDCTIKNDKMPLAAITKTNEDGTKIAKTFKVYTKEGSQYKDTGKEIKTASKGGAVSYTVLDAGVPYYFMEVIADQGYMNPYYMEDEDLNAAFTPADGETAGWEKVEADSAVYFGPFTMEANERKVLFELENRKNTATIQAKKYVPSDNEGGLTPQSGAEFTLTWTKDDGGTGTRTVKSDTDGTIQFKNLYVRHTKGEKAGEYITYTLKETSAPDGYTPSTKVYTITLKEGETAETDSQGQSLEFINVPKVSIGTSKTWTDLWQSQYNRDGKTASYYLSGVEIALFRAPANDGDDAVAKWVETVTTDANGAALFLNQDWGDAATGTAYTYYMAEVRLPDTADELGIVMPRDKEPLPENYKDGVTVGNLKTIYNAASITPDPVKGASVVQGGQADSDSYERILDNPKPYLRFDFMKICAESANTSHLAEHENAVEELIASGKDWTDEYIQMDDGTYHTKVDGAEFTLYRSPTKLTNLNLSLITDEYLKSNWDVVNTYESGALIGSDGERIHGRVATEPVEMGYVYVLVETQAAPGYTLPNPAVVGIFYPDQVNGTAFTATGSTEAQHEKYDAVWGGTYPEEYEYVENPHAEGSGTDYFANVKFNKWSAEFEDVTNPEEYEPLGGAKFNLYLLDGEGNRVQYDPDDPEDPLEAEDYLLDQDIVTGLENSGKGDAVTANALSKIIDIGALQKDEYLEQFVESGQETLEGKPTDYLEIQVELVETYAPNGYETAETSYQFALRAYAGGWRNGLNTNDDYFYIKATDTGTAIVDSFYEEVNVTLRNYGFIPTADDMGKTVSEAVGSKASSEFTLIPGAQYTLQRMNSVSRQYEDYTYGGSSNATVTIGEDGTFTFPRGLQTGQYRLIETKPSDGYYATYDGEAIAKEFTVTYRPQTVDLYNPEKPDVVVYKTVKNPKESDVLSGITFTLTTGGTARTAVTAKNPETGQYEAVFENVDCGTHTLSAETVPETTGTTGAYFTSQQVTVGYGYEAASGAAEKSFARLNGDANVALEEAELTVTNPRLGTLAIQKVDPQITQGEKRIPGAVFKIEFQKFGAGDIDADGNLVEENAPSITDQNWVVIEEEAETTEKELTIRRENRIPGWYKITEKAAPDGYTQIITPVITALTGDMTATVEMEKVVSVENLHKVSFQLTKQLDFGDVFDQTVLDSIHTSGIRFQIVRRDPDSSGSYTAWKSIASFTLKDFTLNPATGKYEAASPVISLDQLSQGSQYAVKETAPEGWTLTDADGSPASLTDDGYLILDGGFDQGTETVSVTLSNRFDKAKITVTKVDKADPSKKLPGAVFGLYNDKEAVSKVGEFTDNGDGTYTITAAANDVNGTTYWIKEESAPANYVLNSEPVEVTVYPGNNLTADGNSSLQITNESGFDLYIHKYDDIPNQGESPLPGVSFYLYQKAKDGGAQAEWEQYPLEQSMVTDSDGQIFIAGLDLASADYAISEVPYGKYVLNSVKMRMNDSGQNEARELQAAGVDPNGYELYPLTGLEAGNTYHVDVYNAKPSELTINKVWSGAGDTSDLKAYVKITNQDTRKVEYENLEITDSATVSLQPGTYLVEETGVEDPAGIYFLNKDDARTRTTVEIPKDTNCTLTNEKADAALSLAKTADKTEIGNLWWEENDITYTITPSGSNSLPLTGYELTDTGLTMKIQDTATGQDTEIGFDSPLYDTYIKEKYAITSVTLSKVTHNVDNLLNAEIGGEEAVVTAYNFDGNVVHTDTVDVSGDADESGLTITYDPELKVKYFTVSYEDTVLKGSSINGDKEDGKKYVLGRNFDPGMIQTTVHLFTQDAEIGDEKLMPVTEIQNHADVRLTYQKPDGKGELTGAAIEKTASSEMPIPVHDPKAAVVTLEKTVSPDRVNPMAGDNNTLDYTIRLKNLDEGTGPMEDPMLVDPLPLGTRYLEHSFKIEGEAESQVEETDSMMYEDSNTGRRILRLSYDGELNPGDDLVITVKVQVENAALSYGLAISNTAYVTSLVQMEQSTVTNPKKASFKYQTGTEETVWPDGSLNDVSEQVEEQYGDYAYISSSAVATMSLSNSLYLYKEIQGNQDGAYQTGTSDVTMVTKGELEENEAAPENNGRVNFRLNLINGSNDQDIKKIRVADVLPAVGDTGAVSNISRNSRWPLYMTGDIKVYGNDGSELSGDSYDVYVTSETYNSTLREEVESYLAYEGTLGAAWTLAGDDTDWSKVTAFIVDVKDIMLEATGSGENGEAMRIEYTTQVDPDMTYEEKNNHSFQLAANNFSAQYQFVSHGTEGPEVPVKNALTSANVYAKLLPATVEIGGHVWVDADDSGQREQTYDSVFAENYDSYDFTGNNSASNLVWWMMKDSAFVRAVELSHFQGSMPSGASSAGSDGNILAGNTYRFVNLAPAVPQNGLDLYDENEELIVSSLTGSDPDNYQLQITTNTLPDELDGISVKLAKTTWGDDGQKNPQGGYSRDPREGIPDEEQKDNNFSGTGRTYTTDRFFVWPTTGGKTDMSKDIGFVPYRDSFTIKKTDSTGAPLENVSFTIYGPFAPGTAGDVTAADLTEANKVMMGETDANGQIVLEDQLLYLMDYIIVEDAALDGYRLDDAQADGFARVDIKDSTGKAITGWILPAGEVGAEGTRDADGNALYDSEINVTNGFEKGSLKLAKADADDRSNLLSGAEFTLEGKALQILSGDTTVDDPTFEKSAKEFINVINNEEWQTAEGIRITQATSGKSSLTVTFVLTDGEADFGQILPRGSYTLTEVKAPDGYIKGAVRTFTIEKDGDGADYTGTGIITNEPQTFGIRKIAEETGGPLSGVTFNLYQADDTDKANPIWGASGKVTNAEGMITFTMTGLSAGTEYVLAETSGKSGYEGIPDIHFKLVPEKEGSAKLTVELIGSPKDVTVSDDGKNMAVIQVTNTLTTGSITLSKELIGDVTDPITGYKAIFEFALKLEQPDGYTNPVLASKHVTDGDGTVTYVKAVKTSPNGAEGTIETEIQLPVAADGTVKDIGLKANESLTIEGIYYGTAYTVTEDVTAETGFEFAGSVVQTGASSETDSENPVEGKTEDGKDTVITIQNQIMKAQVALTKTFDSDVPDKLPTFRIYDITAHADDPYDTAEDAVEAELVPNSEFDIKLDGASGTYTGISDKILIPGRTYQIVEVLNPNDPISAAYTAKVSGAIQVSVGDSNVIIVNPSGVNMENERAKGWLNVSKVLENYDGETINGKRTFYYSIFKVEGDQETAIPLGIYSVDEEHPTIGKIVSGEQAQAHFVDFGTYRIAEVDENGDEINTGDTSLDYTVSNPDEINLQFDEANNDYTASASITNRENPKGSITVVKEADYVKAGTEFHFLVQDVNNGFYIDENGNRQQDKADAIWTIEAGSDILYTGNMVEVGRKTAKNVPYGTYAVTEVDANGSPLPEEYAYTPSYTVTVGNISENTGNFGTITFTARDMTVTVSNEIGRAGMEIVKTFDDTSAIPEDTNLPSFTIYRIEDAGDPITSADDVAGREAVGEIQIVRQADGTFKGELAKADLIPGYYYQAVENLADDEISKLYDPLVSDVIMAAVNDDGTQIPVVSFGKALENQRQRGYLRISKNLENAYGEQTGTGRTFYYVVQDENGNAITLPETYQADASRPTVGMISANDEVHTILVEFGTYSVYETDAEGNVYDADYPNPDYEVRNPEPVAIKIGNADPSDEGTLAVIRNKERDLGKLTIVKQADYADAGSSFYFLVEDERGQYLTSDGTLLDKDTASPSQAKWTITAEEDVTYISDAENEGHGKLSVIGYEEAENIPYGSYTVTEVDAEGNPLGESFAYEVSSRTAVEDSQGQITETEGGTGEITIYQRSMAVTVTNLVKKTHLTIEKTFDSHVPSEENLPKFAVYQLADPNRPITSPDEIGEGDIQVATVSIASRSDGSRTYYGGETDDILIPGYSYQAVEILADDEISKLYDPLTGENHVMTVTLEEDGMAVNALAYTAENIRSYGYLTVTKELFDYYGESLDDVRTFYYRIRNTETGEYVTIEPEYRPENAQDLTQVAEITTAAGDENVHFVKYGTYEIVETDENGNVYNDSESLISGFVNGLLGRETNPTYIVENPEPVEIILDNADTASASIANRERALGELTIVKETDWAESGQTEFYFTVQNEKGELLDAPAQGLAAIASLFKSQDARKIWTITADRTTDTMAEVGRLTIGELPYGIYTVTEVDQNGDALDEYPYTVSYQVEVSGKDAVSSAEEGQGELDYQHPSMTVTVTNTRNKGYLTVRKNLQDYQGNTLTGTGRQFYFTVLDEDGNAVELPEEFRYEGQQYVGWITDNTSRELFLPYGTYRVLETDEEGRPYNAQNENLLYEVTTPDAVELSLANADSAEAVIVNKEKAIGSLTVTKRVNRTANGTTFYFIVTNSKGERMPMPDENGNPTEETIWRISASRNVMTDTAIGSLTLKNLPYDTYTVTEVRENGEALADSYIYNVSYETTAQGVTASGQSGTITIDARDMDVTVTNTRKTGGGSGDGDGGGGGGSDGGGGGSTITVTTDVPTASITDPGIPLSPYPGDGSVIIPEGEVPLFGLPKTGDNSISAAGLAGIMLAALLSACGIIRKRKKEEES